MFLQRMIIQEDGNERLRLFIDNRNFQIAHKYMLMFSHLSDSLRYINFYLYQ